MTGVEVRELIAQAVSAGAESLVSPGDWLTAGQRRAAWIEVRDARTNPLDLARAQAISPEAVTQHHEATDELSADAVDVVHRITSDPGRLTRAWADRKIDALGDAVYVELVGVVAIAMVIDLYTWTLTGSDPEIGSARAGQPCRVRPQSVGDVGAWVPQSIDKRNANVSRSLSLVPETNSPWIGLVDALYSRGPGFFDLEWDRALTRPQVELVASRTTAELECFY